jgi:uncharacterized membrane protein YkoI
MILVRTMLTGVLVLGATAVAGAADHCLTRNEQKARTAAHGVVPLSRAMRSVKQHGEVIQARLCEHGGRLVYQLTVLGRDGKVAQTSVDAANGALIGPRGPGK